MSLCSHPHHALRRAWANLASFAAPITLSSLAAPSPLRSHILSHTSILALSTRSFHVSTHLYRQRRWRGEDSASPQRDTRETDDDYIHYTARIQPLDATTPAAAYSPTITPASTTIVPLTSATTSSSSSRSTSSSTVIHLTATPEQSEPAPSSAAYREALFAARDARRAQAVLLRSVHSSGPSRRVRQWQSNQKRLRTRATRRRNKYAMNQLYEREQDAMDNVKHPELRDEQ